MDCDIIQKFRTWNLFDLLAKNKDEANSHPDNTKSSTIPNTKPSSKAKETSSYVHGRFEKSSSLYAVIKEEYSVKTQMKYLVDKIKFSF